MSALVAQPASFQSTLLRVSGFQDLEAFQSTLSMRRATPFLGEITEIPLISIHALHEESDTRSPDIGLDRTAFQSTLSMRRATRLLLQFPPFVDISIHALHEESDHQATIM